MNLRPEIINYNGAAEIAVYCSVMRDGGEIRTEWQGDTVFCLDKRTEES